jgi:pilus assembly protein CpaF
MVSDDLILKYSEDVLKALFDDNSRERLKKHLIRDYSNVVRGNLETVEYILAESIGTGFVERILKMPNVTDIGWNGKFLTVDTPFSSQVFTQEELGIVDCEEYIVRVITKFANAVGKAFNDQHPVLDSAFMNVRINAVHKSIAPMGTTLSMRLVKPYRALNEDNFEDFAPMFVLKFFENAVKTGANMVISGTTGTGKTELQKAILGYVADNDRICTIEDVQEMHLKTLYPKKDVFSWLTNPNFTISDGVKASLRNNPRWVVVSETRGSEAFEMLQAVLTGHKIVTTLHATSAFGIPRRFVGMCKGAYDMDEEMLERDVLGNFDFGCHIKRMNYKGRTIRYLAEIVEYHEDGITPLFTQVFRHGHFYITCGTPLSREFVNRMAEKGLPEFYFPVCNDKEVPKPVLAEITKQEDEQSRSLLERAELERELKGREGIE